MSDIANADVPAAERCVVRNLLERRAAAEPEKVYALFPGGREWTNAEALADARRIAAALQRLGVKKGDRVVTWLPNDLDHMRMWFGINYLGAVFVPVNLAYRGGILEHVIRNANASLIIVHRDLVPRLDAIDISTLETAIVLGGDAKVRSELKALGPSALEGAELGPLEPVAPWDTMMIIFTSGTTGPSKGVLTSYAHAFATTAALHWSDDTDRDLIVLPMFHIGGVTLSHGMLAKGGSIAVVDAFDTHAFWDVIRTTRCTLVTLLGVMAPFLMRQPEGPQDREHTLKKVSMIPLSVDPVAFSKRFGVDVYSAYNMTEISSPLVSPKNPTAVGSCGRPRPGVEVRLVDENDCQIPDTPEAIGELVVRAAPWAMNSGYNNNPEATARAWRNGWFHTGDAFRRDKDGNYYFVDRMKDAIRRRGENISSFEVEAELCAHPAIREAAAVAVPNELSEDEVLAVVALAPGKTLDHEELFHFLVPRMAHFMLPRYIRVLDNLPRTPSQKVEKYLLRREGITADTWDREKAGIVVKREKIGRAR